MVVSHPLFAWWSVFRRLDVVNDGLSGHREGGDRYYAVVVDNIKGTKKHACMRTMGHSQSR
jgi:hypothetical protein